MNKYVNKNILTNRQAIDRKVNILKGLETDSLTDIQANRQTC